MRSPPTSRPALRERVDVELRAFLVRQRERFAPGALVLLDEIEAVVAAGGKRLRPLFCYWGHIAGGGSECEEIVRTAAALELLHTFAIVHDDVMDRSPMRRGRPASFRALAGVARSIPHRGDPERMGVSAAILAGDLAFVLADTMLHECGFTGERLAKAIDRFDAMRVRAVAGQYLDLAAAHAGTAAEEEAMAIAALKSGGYTVADPLAVGAALAGADAGVERTLEAYGRPLGEAFQLRDDVLGVFGDAAVTGKDRDGDLREGKQTLLVARARTLASAQDGAFLDANLGRPGLDPGSADRIREIIRRTGALEGTLELIASLAERARSALVGSAIPRRAVDALAALADEVVTRDA